MIAIAIDSVLQVIYAQSALYYHLHGGERPTVLHHGHRKALEECVKNSFATMSVRLLPYLADVSSSGDAGIVTCEFRPCCLEVVSEPRIRIALEAALAHYTLHLVATCEDRNMAVHFLNQYTAVMEDLERSMDGKEGPVRLTAHYV